VGGDLFTPYRFFAPVLPGLFVAGAVALAGLLERQAAAGVLAAALFCFLVVPHRWPWPDAIAPAGSNGDPFDQVVVARFVAKNFPPSTKIHVIAAGIVPYFTDAPAIDGLGKSERHIARLPFLPGSAIGHGKHDFEYSLGLGADLVVSYRPLETVQAYASGAIVPGPGDYVGALLSTPRFVRDYLPHLVEDRFLATHTALLLRENPARGPGAYTRVAVDYEPSRRITPPVLRLHAVPAEPH
jgi:hypothetical protein